MTKHCAFYATLLGAKQHYPQWTCCLQTCNLSCRLVHPSSKGYCKDQSLDLHKYEQQWIWTHM
jgi:hypothetical protein